MGSAERRERHRQELRERILETARALIVEYGLEAVTIRRIARAIEYSPTALYLHFKDKESLIQELCEQDFRSLARALVTIIDVEDPIERLRLIGQAYVKFAVEHPEQYKFMFMTPNHPPPSEETMAHKQDPRENGYLMLRNAVTAAIDAGALREELTDPDLVAQLFWGAVHGPIALELVMKDDAFVDWQPTIDVCHAAIEVLVRGVAR